MVTPELSLDLQQIKSELDLGIRLLGTANSQLGLHRRLTLKRYLSPGFKRLCDEHHPLTQYMFGGNIKATIDDTTKINRMVAESQGSRGKPFLGRGRGRSRGGFSRGGGHFVRRGGYRGFRGGRGRANSFPQNQNQAPGRGRSQRGAQQSS